MFAQDLSILKFGSPCLRNRLRRLLKEFQWADLGKHKKLLIQLYSWLHEKLRILLGKKLILMAVNIWIDRQQRLYWDVFRMSLLKKQIIYERFIIKNDFRHNLVGIED